MLSEKLLSAELLLSWLLLVTRVGRAPRIRLLKSIVVALSRLTRDMATEEAENGSVYCLAAGTRWRIEQGYQTWDEWGGKALYTSHTRPREQGTRNEAWYGRLPCSHSLTSCRSNSCSLVEACMWPKKSVKDIRSDELGFRRPLLN